MANKYSRVSNFGTETHFSEAVTGELAYSRMVSSPEHLTTFNAGDIVPIYCMEILPHDTIEMSMDMVIRQSTLRTPTMGTMEADFYAFFVPNRVVNKSWKTVMGENPNGSWTAPDITLAPLVANASQYAPSNYTIPPESVADYYGFPTQKPLPVNVLRACHDLKFRGYVEIYNEFFRDQNYQPPIPYSKLNIFEGFFDHASQVRSASVAGDIAAPGGAGSMSYNYNSLQDNSVGLGSVLQETYGNIGIGAPSNGAILGINLMTTFDALGKPLKANKLHDYFTSVLPSPQKGPQVLLPLTGNAPVVTGTGSVPYSGEPMFFRRISGDAVNGAFGLYTYNQDSIDGQTVASASSVGAGATVGVYPSNLFADLSQVTSATLNDLRMAAAVQQVYEALARGGSRYRETVRILFGLEVDNPYEDIPTCLGHFRRTLDLYQTAQTSASESGNTPQGNLAAFGYTAANGYLFKRTFLEHGYVHVLAVVRHKNIYSSFLSRDNFRTSMMDFYQPPLANISEQPVYTREINPYAAGSGSGQVFGYQEAWAEYRYDPDYVSGYMRPGVSNSLDIWNYADTFNSSILIATGDWMKSNSEDVLNRSLVVTSSVASQLKGQFKFKIDKERPMPTYSVPGLDIF